MRPRTRQAQSRQSQPVLPPSRVKAPSTGRRRCSHGQLPAFADDTFLRGQGHGCDVALTAGQSVAPSGLHMAGFQVGQGQAHGGGVVQRLNLRKESQGDVVAHDYIVSQSLNVSGRAMTAGTGVTRCTQ